MLNSFSFSSLAGSFDFKDYSTATEDTFLVKGLDHGLLFWQMPLVHADGSYLRIHGLLVLA